MIGAAIGPYRVTRLLGSGGMGAVYAAEHTLLGRSVAIKVLLPELSQKQEVVLRFFNEARAATAIRHPGIVEIYDFGSTGEGAAFIVMEYLEGESLAQRIARARPAWPAVLVIARQIAGALAAAHAKAIVHRDVKPDNVFLIPDPEVPGGERIKLLDFGIAKLLVEAPTAPSVTRTGATLGTPTYMAPEQCRGLAVDHRADLYSLGCVMYELCCGRPPFVGEGAGDVLAAHIHLPAPPLAGAAPPAVEQLIAALLVKPAAERVQSALELIQRIDAITSDRSMSGTMPVRFSLPAGTRPDRSTTLSGSVSSMQLPQATRRRWPVAAVGFVVAAITVAAISLAMHRSHEVKVDVRAAVGSGDGAPPSVPPARGSESSNAPSPSPAATSTQAAIAPVVNAGGSAAGPQAAAVAEPAAAASTAGSAAAVQASVPAPVRPAEAVRVRSSAAAGAVVAREVGGADVIPVMIDSEPAGAQVVLGGRVLGTTPFRGTLARGDRDVIIVIRMARYGERVVIARPSRPIRERIVLVHDGAAKPTHLDRDRGVNPF